MITLKIISYHYTCGDGCCDDFYDKVFIDDKEIDGHFINVDDELLVGIIKNLKQEEVKVIKEEVRLNHKLED